MSRMRARIQRHRDAGEHARAVARALLEAVGDDRIGAEPPTNGGDRERLRGIPVIGPATGAVRGTIPGRGRAIDEWEGRWSEEDD